MPAKAGMLHHVIPAKAGIQAFLGIIFSAAMDASLRWHDALAFAGMTLCILLCLWSNYTFALPDDARQLVHISANSSQFNYKNGNNIYEGDVNIDQGSTHIIADRVVTQANHRHKIEEAIAYGIKKPAIYRTTPKPGDPVFTAKANVIKYYPFKETIILEGNVTVKQGENSFHGPIIIYNINKQIVTAPSSKQGRANIIIKPT